MHSVVWVITGVASLRFNKASPTKLDFSHPTTLLIRNPVALAYKCQLNRAMHRWVTNSSITFGPYFFGGRQFASPFFQRWSIISIPNYRAYQIFDAHRTTRKCGNCDALQFEATRRCDKFQWDSSIHGWDKTTSIFEFYFRLLFSPNFRYRRVILHWPAKFRHNRTTHGGVMASYRLRCLWFNNSALL